MLFRITKTNLLLTLIFLLALALRLIAASHAVIAADELVYSSLAVNILSAGRLSTWQQSHLFFTLNDLGYLLFGGVTPISTRLPSIIFGSFAVFAVFLVARELFGQKAGLVSSFLFAVSGYAVRFNYETDMPAFFFVLLSMFFFLRALSDWKQTHFYLSALFFGLAILTKNIVLVFIPAYAIIGILQYIKCRRAPSVHAPPSAKRLLKTAFVSAAILLLLLSPIFIYNYLLYKDKGVTDFYFATFLGIGKNVYAGLENRPWSAAAIPPRLEWLALQFLRFDGLLFAAGITGIIFSFRQRRHETLLFLLSFLFLYGYLIGITGSPTHYLWVPLVLSIFAGHLLFLLHRRVAERFHLKHFLAVALAVIFLFNMVFLWDILTKKNAVLTLREYVHEHIPDSAVVVLDPRIYRGIYAWAFNDRHYIEGTAFPELIRRIEQSGLPRANIPIYYIECGKGTTCIWSTEDYERVNSFGEQLTAHFSANAEQVASITGKAVKAGDRHTFNIYRGTFAAPPSVYEAVDRAQLFWLYPVGWKYTDDVFDNYTPRGSGRLLNGLGFAALYASLLAALLSLPLVAFLAFRHHSQWHERGEHGAA